MLDNSHACTRNKLAGRGSISFQTATVAGVTQNGGVGDLQGDGYGGNLSPALTNMKQSNDHEVPTAMIAGLATKHNLDGLDTWFVTWLIRHRFCPNDSLAQNFTSQGWPEIMKGGTSGSGDSDGLVTTYSAWNGGGGSDILSVDKVHSPGLVKLGFNGPAELDPNSATNIPAVVIQLLNTPSNWPAFTKLP